MKLLKNNNKSKNKKEIEQKVLEIREMIIKLKKKKKRMRNLKRTTQIRKLKKLKDQFIRRPDRSEN